MSAVDFHSSTARRSAGRALALLACAQLAWFAAGCASSANYHDRAMCASCDRLLVVTTATPEAAAASAAREHEGDFTLTGLGDSMRPRYAAGTALVVHPTSYFMLRVGMPVVYRGRNGHQIAHVLVEECARGWVAIGLNNADPDDEYVTAQNLVGVVTCAYVPTDLARDLSRKTTLAFAETSSSPVLH